jgi:hypothetical protein
MKIFYDKNLISKLAGGFLFLDTNSLISLINFEGLFTDFLIEIKNVDCALLTIPSVVFEFSRTENIGEYNKRTAFIKAIVDVYHIEKHLEEMQELVPVIHKIGGRLQYTDFLLYACLYHFKNKAFLMTENHKDFQTSILDRDIVLTIDTDGIQIRNTGIYSLNFDKYNKAAQKILSK